MRILKYNNKLIYTKFSRKDLKNIRKDLTSNVNKIEIIMNDIGGCEFDDEIRNISSLYNMIKKYYTGKVRIILYTMNNNLHRMVKYQLGVNHCNHEDGILRMYGGRYVFVDHNTGATHYFYKCDWNLYHVMELDHHIIKVCFSEKFFNSDFI